MKEITSESIHTLLGSFPTGLCLSSCLSFIGQEMLPLVTTTLPSSKASDAHSSSRLLLG